MKKNDGNAYLDGGHVRGPGTDTSDSIPANLSNGEFVVNATIVKRPGMLDFLKKLNAGDTGIHQHVERQNPKPPKTKHLATGGYFSNGGLATDNDMQSLMDAKNDPSVQQDPALIDPNASHPDDLAIGMPKQAPSSQDDNTPPQDPRLTAALAQQNKQQSLADLLKGFQTLASARAIGYGAKPDYSAVDTLNKQASQPVEQYNNQLNQENTLKKLKEAADEHKAKMDEFQVNLAKSNLDLTNDKDNSDPNSDISKITRERVIEKSKENGQPVNEDTLSSLSAKQLFPMFPYLHQDAVNVLNDKKLTEEIKSREAIAREGMQTKKDIADQRSEDRADAKSDAKDAKASGDYDKYVNSVEKQAETLRGDDAARRSSLKLSAIASGRALTNQYKGHEGDMSPDQLAILAADRVQAVTGATPGVEEIRHMMPSNWSPGMAVSNLRSGVTGAPAAAHQGGWVQEANKDFDAQEKSARDILTNRQKQITSNPRLKPEDKARISQMAVPPEINSSSTGPLGETTTKDGKNYRWNADAGKYQLDQ